MAEDSKAGRPPKYNIKLNERVYRLCLLGLTDELIADCMEISVSTLNEWKKKYKKFSESMSLGKTNADANVAAMLHKRAIGYTFDEVTYEKVDVKIDGVEQDPNDIKHEVFKKKIVTKEVAPDVTAQKYILNNRQPKLWRDKKEVDFNGNLHLSDEPIIIE